MDILLKGVTVIDPSSPFHQQTLDILVQNGFIAEAGAIEKVVDKIISIKDLHVAPGFADIFSNFCDPGFEYRETLETGTIAAASGGYTDVFVIPNTEPVVHHKSGIEYLVQKSKMLAVNIHPIGAISKNAEGKELAEMYDMHKSGAVAFSDGINSLQAPGVLLKALQYLKAIDKTVIQLPGDKSISPQGLMNEGIISTQLGLAGKPAIAEEIMIRRDIELVKYTESRLHFTGVSTAVGINLIREAKKQGIKVTCSITPYHLAFTDEDLREYDTNLKLSPPLRLKEDQEGLKEAITDRTVDCIASHHIPQHADNKVVEFEYANDGMIALETCFAAVRTAMPALSLERLIELFSTTPRQLFDLPKLKIASNEPASLSLFLPDQKWTPERFYSKSKNSAFTGKTLTGKPVGIISKDQVLLSPQ
jgi:dihydroorotase